MRETTALGAAIAAGLAVGLWRNFAELRDINRSGGAVFEPQILQHESAAKFRQWEKAVQMSRGWVDTGSPEKEEDTGLKNMMCTPIRSHDVAPQKIVHNSDQAVVSEVFKSPEFTTTFKGMARISVKEIEVPPAPTGLMSLLGDLDDADEEDLFLELRKVEILQRLKKLQKHKSNCY